MQRAFSPPVYLRGTCILVVAMIVTGCSRGHISESTEGPTKDALVEYYSPKSIKILQFTKPASFDQDAVPDGIAVFLRPLDGAGDPVKAYGTLLFEVYEYRPATPGHRGEIVQQWRQPVVTPDDQRQFWDRIIYTYEFQLVWEGAPLPPDKRYILSASFESPGSRRLFDEYQFEFRIPASDVREALIGGNGS